MEVPSCCLNTSGLLEITCVGGCLDSLQQLVVLGVEGDCEGAVDDVPIDVCAKVCSRGRGHFLAASSEARLNEAFAAWQQLVEERQSALLSLDSDSLPLPGSVQGCQAGSRQLQQRSSVPVAESEEEWIWESQCAGPHEQSLLHTAAGSHVTAHHPAPCHQHPAPTLHQLLVTLPCLPAAGKPQLLYDSNPTALLHTFRRTCLLRCGESFLC